MGIDFNRRLSNQETPLSVAEKEVRKSIDSKIRQNPQFKAAVSTYISAQTAVQVWSGSYRISRDPNDKKYLITIMNSEQDLGSTWATDDLETLAEALFDGPKSPQPPVQLLEKVEQLQKQIEELKAEHAQIIDQFKQKLLQNQEAQGRTLLELESNEHTPLHQQLVEAQAKIKKLSLSKKDADNQTEPNLSGTSVTTSTDLQTRNIGISTSVPSIQHAGTQASPPSSREIGTATNQSPEIFERSMQTDPDDELQKAIDEAKDLKKQLLAYQENETRELLTKLEEIEQHDIAATEMLQKEFLIEHARIAQQEDFARDDIEAIKRLENARIQREKLPPKQKPAVLTPELKQQIEELEDSYEQLEKEIAQLHKQIKTLQSKKPNLSSSSQTQTEEPLQRHLSAEELRAKVENYNSTIHLKEQTNLLEESRSKLSQLEQELSQKEAEQKKLKNQLYKEQQDHEFAEDSMKDELLQIKHENYALKSENKRLQKQSQEPLEVARNEQRIQTTDQEFANLMALRDEYEKLELEKRSALYSEAARERTHRQIIEENRRLENRDLLALNQRDQAILKLEQELFYLKDQIKVLENSLEYKKKQSREQRDINQTLTGQIRKVNEAGLLTPRVSGFYGRNVSSMTSLVSQAATQTDAQSSSDNMYDLPAFTNSPTTSETSSTLPPISPSDGTPSTLPNAVEARNSINASPQPSFSSTFISAPAETYAHYLQALISASSMTVGDKQALEKLWKEELSLSRITRIEDKNGPTKTDPSKKFDGSTLIYHYRKPNGEENTYNDARNIPDQSTRINVHTIHDALKSFLQQQNTTSLPAFGSHELVSPSLSLFVSSVEEISKKDEQLKEIIATLNATKGPNRDKLELQKKEREALIVACCWFNQLSYYSKSTPSLDIRHIDSIDNAKKIVDRFSQYDSTQNKYLWDTTHVGKLPTISMEYSLLPQLLRELITLRTLFEFQKSYETLNYTKPKDSLLVKNTHLKRWAPIATTETTDKMGEILSLTLKSATPDSEVTVATA